MREIREDDSYKDDGVPRGKLPDGSYWVQSGDYSYVGKIVSYNPDDGWGIKPEFECLEIKTFGKNSYARWVKRIALPLEISSSLKGSKEFGRAVRDYVNTKN